MQEFITIEKDPEVKNSQDFAFLKEQGLKHIEALASDLWTDYNEHDPGVTLMEVLAYAITDLGYRTGYEVKDILTPDDSALNNHKDTFHKATEILPCNQVTELDLREILIDIEGIRNVWVKIATTFENTYFVNYEQSVLSATDPNANPQEEVTSLNGLYHIVVEFDRLVIPIDMEQEERKEKERKVLELAKARLMEYRNFCEDYFVGVRRYKASKTPVTEVITKPLAFDKVVLWADVEVEPNADMEKIHAQIYFDVEQFLVPYATFYSLHERIKKGNRIDEIFEGPLLEHGFIIDDELEKIKLFECIHTSDLYQVIMDVPGVKAVKSLKIANYISDDGITPRSNITIEEGGEFSLKKLLETRGEEWCLELYSNASKCEYYELMLETVNSNPNDPVNKTIKFYTGENSVPVTINQSRSLDQLNVMRQNDRKRRERLRVSSIDLNVPEGNNQQIEAYYPVQNELPLVYGTGLDGLAEDVSEERKAQAKQLKGFLLFFEQLLTNYLAQLNNVRHLFSWDETIDKTYYTQLLEDIKDRGELYVEEYDSMSLSPNGILDETRLKELIQSDAENYDVFFDRRSRFLNHLIARFNEKFVEYSLILHSMGLEERLLSDKSKFLKEYDLISMNRGKGFDYTRMREVVNTSNSLVEPDVWDTKNVTGYQHRVCRFLGLSDESRRFLYSGHDMRIEAHDVSGVIQYRYVLVLDADNGTEIIGSLFVDEMDAFDQFEELIENEGKDNITNVPSNPNPSEYLFTIENSDNSDLLGTSKVYETSAERDNVIAEVTTYFNDVSAFLTELEYDSFNDKWKFKIEVTAYNPSFYINGGWENSEAAAQSALNAFMDELKADTLGFAVPSIGEITNNEFYFQVINNSGIVIATSDSDVFAGSRDASIEGMNMAEEFFSDSIGYMNTEGGLHVVEHLLLRPKTDEYALFDVDVKPYDSIATAENPPVAYPVDYDGIYELENYKEQYFLSEEVELSLSSDNQSGDSVNVIEPYFYTLSENQEKPDEDDIFDTVAGTSVTWERFLSQLNTSGGSVYEFTYLVSEDPVDRDIWFSLLDQGLGCKYENYLFGSLDVDGITFNYYFIVNGDVLLGGLVSSVLTSEEVKERALRTLAYFCENTTCKGISNPYEFKATVVLPAWTKRARDYNYREYAEETIRLEAPAHVALEIKWVNRSQMREFEICYRKWLMRQGEFLYLDRNIQSGLDEEIAEMSVWGGNSEELEGIFSSSNVSNSYAKVIDAAECLISKIDELVNVFQSAYKTVVRNDQYFTNNPAAEGYVIAWISDALDGSVVNKAELVGGILPSFLGFYTGEEILSTSGLTTSGTFNSGDFMILDPAAVTAGEWTFSVKTYSDTGQVSCTDVIIKIIPDLEAVYKAIPGCYAHLAIGDIVSEIDDPNGVIFSAEILSGTLPSSLKLIENYTDLNNWAASHGLDPNNYQPGDIVVDSLLTNAINDSLAVPATSNEIVTLEVKITDITGGITVFTASPNVYNTGAPPGVVPLVVYGNALLYKTPETCRGKHVATYDLSNTIYGLPSDVLTTFYDGHEGEGVVLSSASVLVDVLSGINVRIVNGRAEIYVDDYALFETYIEGFAPDGEGVVSIPTKLSVVDTCGFGDTWIGTLCVRPDTEAIAVEDVTSCAGKYINNPVIISVSDMDNGIHSYELSDMVETVLTSMGIGHEIVSASPYNLLQFTVDNSTLFLAAIQNATLFNGTEEVNGIEVNVYNFDVETYDNFGGNSITAVKVYAPVNEPLVCTKVHPDGTSYLAYLNNVQYYDPKGKYIPVTSQIGKTIITFSDANGIDSIDCSCKDCKGNAFPVKTAPWEFGVLGAILSPDKKTEYGIEINFGVSQKTNTPVGKKQASAGSKAKKGKASLSEKAWKQQTNAYFSQEKFIRPYVNQLGLSYVPINPKPKCECLSNLGLALDCETNRIYVADSKKFAENGVGTKRFSITVIDGCGIKTCKEITLVIGEDKKAYYIDVKNNSYLNALSNGDVIGYPEDPDGNIVKADIILYNEVSGYYASPYKPEQLLPPGTKLNKITGEIKVDSATNLSSSPTYVEVVGTTQKSKKTTYLDTTDETKTSTQGYSIFKQDVSVKKQSGVAKYTADWNIDKTQVKNPQLELNNGYIKDWAKESPWIKNTGKLTSGSWTIYVLTKDTFGGVSVIKYMIVIKKNKLITSVAGQLGYSGYKGVKEGLNENYKNILSTSNTSLNVTETVVSPKDEVLINESEIITSLK